MAQEDSEYPEIRRLRDLLRLLFRIYDKTFKDVEKAAGLGFGSFSKVFSHLREFRLEHILDFCKAVGLTPTEFFHWAYPNTSAPPSQAALKLYEVQKVLAGGVAEVGPAGKAPVRLPFVLLERHWQKLAPATRRDLLETLAEDGRLYDSHAP
jgi:hypothetical protein